MRVRVTMLAAAFVLGELAAGCRREARTTVEARPVQPDATPTTDSGPPRPASGDGWSGAGRWVVIRGQVVDLRDRRVVKQLLEPSPQHALTDATSLFVASEDHVTAFELPAGTQRWSTVQSPRCEVLLQNDADVLCVTAGEVRAFRKADGAARSLYTPASGGITEAAIVDGGLVVVDRNHAFELVSTTTGQLWGHLPALTGDLDSSYDPELLVSGDRSVFCLLRRLTTNYAMSCHRASGAQLYGTGWPHTDVEVDGNVYTHYPVLHVREVSGSYVLFSSLGGDRHRARVVRMDSGQQVASVDREVTALVEDADGTLRGLLAVGGDQPTFSLLDADGRTVRWSIPDANDEGNASVALAGDRLVISPYSQIATGAALLCADLSTGRVLWRADVEQLMVGHSQYLNAVELRVGDGEVAMIGREAGGEYVQIFDLSTGARLFSTISRGW